MGAVKRYIEGIIYDAEASPEEWDAVFASVISGELRLTFTDRQADLAAVKDWLKTIRSGGNHESKLDEHACDDAD